MQTLSGHCLFSVLSLCGALRRAQRMRERTECERSQRTACLLRGVGTRRSRGEVGLSMGSRGGQSRSRQHHKNYNGSICTRRMMCSTCGTCKAREEEPK